MTWLTFRDAASVERGDVAVFDAAWRDGQTYTFIWSVLGLPGEYVVVDRHRVAIDGAPLEHTDPHTRGDRHVATETAAEGSWQVAWPIAPTEPSHAVTADLVVPDGHVYVLGDNRLDALDSRTAGPIPVADIIGCVR